jgi:hypothetical protein
MERFLMKKNTEIISSIVYMLLVLSFGLPFISFEGYSILSNTTSHLAALESPYAWVINTVMFFPPFMRIHWADPTEQNCFRTVGNG